MLPAAPALLSCGDEDIFLLSLDIVSINGSFEAQGNPAGNSGRRLSKAVTLDKLLQKSSFSESGAAARVACGHSIRPNESAVNTVAFGGARLVEVLQKSIKLGVGQSVSRQRVGTRLSLSLPAKGCKIARVKQTNNQAPAPVSSATCWTLFLSHSRSLQICHHNND